MSPDYRILRSARRTLALEITPAGEVLVRAPKRMSEGHIRAFVESRQGWLEKHLAALGQREAVPKLTHPELEALKAEARPLLLSRAEELAPKLGVSFGRVTVRTQRTRWGSCSNQGNLNFNALLLLAPAEVQEYVVAHELAHRREMNHSPRFWALVEGVIPDWRERRAWLKKNGASLLARLPEK